MLLLVAPGLAAWQGGPGSAAIVPGGSLVMPGYAPPQPAAWTRRHPVADAPKTMGNLTARELEVLAMIADGVSNVGVARQLFLSIRTVECYVARIFGKLGLEHDVEGHRRVCAALAYHHWAAAALAPAHHATCADAG